jgi:hypothetical protein
MWAEYAGIVAATVAQLFAMKRPLTFAFRPMRKYPQLFDGGDSSVAWDILCYAIFQILIEIVTDAGTLPGSAARRGATRHDATRRDAT